MVELKVIEKEFGKKKAAAIVSQMVRQGLINRSYELAPVRMKPRSELYISMAGSGGEDLKLSPKQATLFGFLKEQSRSVPWTEARKKTGCSKSIADALVRRGLVIFNTVEVRRETVSYENIVTSYPLNLTADQQAAFEAIKAELSKPSGDNLSPRVFLR
jgi:primosomal protein N' (replication factor Y)